MYIPGTQTALVLDGKAIVMEGWPSNIEVTSVLPGIHMMMQVQPWSLMEAGWGLHNLNCQCHYGIRISFRRSWKIWNWTFEKGMVWHPNVLWPLGVFRERCIRPINNGNRSDFRDQHRWSWGMDSHGFWGQNLTREQVSEALGAAALIWLLCYFHTFKKEPETHGFKSWYSFDMTFSWSPTKIQKWSSNQPVPIFYFFIHGFCDTSVACHRIEWLRAQIMEIECAEPASRASWGPEWTKEDFLLVVACLVCYGSKNKSPFFDHEVLENFGCLGPARSSHYF